MKGIQDQISGEKSRNFQEEFVLKHVKGKRRYEDGDKKNQVIIEKG